MQSKLNLIAEKARQDKALKFSALVHHINEENLARCYHELKRNKASGIDGVTVEAYGMELQDNLKALVARMKTKSYRPQPVRRVYIPKPGKAEKRELGIPAVEDKLVQLMLKKILEAIYEADFLDCSCGFRPSRSCHTAIKKLDEIVMTKPVNYVVEVDIRKFFDNVQHYWMLRCIEERIVDTNLKWLILRFLKAGVMEEGCYRASKVGTPQGGIVSPLLANIYLHYVLDLWFAKGIKRESKGYMELVRYCDDFVVCCENKQDAEEFLEKLQERLAQFGLEIAPDKTRMLKFGRQAWYQSQNKEGKPESFDFLGFTHHCKRSRKGKFIMGHKTCKQNLARKLKETNEWLKAVRSMVKLQDWWPILKSKLTGHYNYFGISGNYRSIKQYYYRVVKLAYKWINRRSQKPSMSWERFNNYLQIYALPMPRIKYNLYTLSPARGNAALKSRVRENRKHGSVGVTMVTKLLINNKEE